MANVNPNYWFLPEADMAAFRRPAFTSNNVVEPLIDGKAYMDHLTVRFEAMGAGDYYYFTAWRATPTHPLQPDKPSSPTYLGRLQALANSGVTIKGMLWCAPRPVLDVFGATPKHAPENIEMVNGLNGLVGAKAQVILDNRLPSYVASHHQKSSILSSAGHHWAHVGGIDIALDRWDTPSHNSPPQRPQEKYAGWHDVHCAIRGAAVAQIWDNYRQRWNDKTPPHSVRGLPGGDVPDAIPQAAAPGLGPAYGQHHIQVLRTLACRNTYSFLPDGEQTVRLAHERAIDNAQHFVYIEDQYAWPSSLAERLNAAARRGVKIIIVLSRAPYKAYLGRKHDRMRHDRFLNRVRDGAASNVFVFHLQQPEGGCDIYVHSKVMIIDDCYASIGSANVNLRSHTTDSELQVAIVDGETVSGQMDGCPVTVSHFAKQLRMDLWQEHLNMGQIDDPITGLANWPSASGPAQRHHAAVHPTPSWYLRWPGVLTSRVMNRNTKC